MLGSARLRHICRAHHWYLIINSLAVLEARKETGLVIQDSTSSSAFVKPRLFHSVFLNSKILKSPHASGWGSAYLSLLPWFASHLFCFFCCWDSKHLVTSNDILLLVLRFNSSSSRTSGRTESPADPPGQSVTCPQGISASRVALRRCILPGCSFDRKGVGYHGEPEFLALSGWRQGSKAPLYPSEPNQLLLNSGLLCTWTHLSSWTSIYPSAGSWWSSWGPGSAFMFSITIFEASISLWRSWALVSENTGLDPSDTPLPWQRDKTLTLDRSCLALQGRSVFLLLPLWSLTLYMLLNAGLQ